MENMNFIRLQKTQPKTVGHMQTKKLSDLNEFVIRRPDETPIHDALVYKHHLNYQLIVMTTMKKQFLTQKIHSDIKALLAKNVANWNIGIVNYEAGQYYFQLKFTVDANINLHQMIESLKQFTSKFIKKNHAYAINNYQIRESVWKKGYFLASLGQELKTEITKYLNPHEEVVKHNSL